MSGKTDESIRLNKFLAQCGLASRRGADDLITQGRVTVNGAKGEPGMRVTADDAVELDGTPVRQRSRDVTLILHKPVEVVTTLFDPQGRKTVMDLLPDDLRKLRPSPVGRLDFYSEGLLLMTTDGDLCNRLTHPRHHQEKMYEAWVRGKVADNSLSIMRQGMRLKEGEQLAPVGVEAAPQAGNTLLTLTLSQGVNRQIRRMCRDLGLTVLKLRRVRQGRMELKNLQPGQFRLIEGAELAGLRKSVGL